MLFHITSENDSQSSTISQRSLLSVPPSWLVSSSDGLPHRKEKIHILLISFGRKISQGDFHEKKKKVSQERERNKK